MMPVMMVMMVVPVPTVLAVTAVAMAVAMVVMVMMMAVFLTAGRGSTGAPVASARWRWFSEAWYSPGVASAEVSFISN